MRGSRVFNGVCRCDAAVWDKKGARGYPIATVAYYGPDNKHASKVAVGIVPSEGADPEKLEIRLTGVRLTGVRLTGVGPSYPIGIYGILCQK